MEYLARISEGNGWLLTATGVGTVFVCLICIWMFISLYAKLADRKPRQNPNTVPEKPCGCAEVEPLRDEVSAGAMERKDTMETLESLEQQPMVDDTLAKMAAAAAVAAYLKQRNRLSRPPVVSGSVISGWVLSGRSQSLFNLPPRNPWKGGR